MAWRSKVLPRLETDTEQRLREQAELEAIRVFGRNLHDLLLAAPAGQRVTMGLDPGIRTGVKVAVVDGTGRVLDTAAIYPHEPRKDWDGSLRQLRMLVAKHRRRAHRDRQRHGLARNRQARRRLSEARIQS